MQLAEQVVLVTGAGRGLGSAIARAFADAGARVVVNYRRSRAAAEALVDELGDERALAVIGGGEPSARSEPAPRPAPPREAWAKMTLR